MGWTDERKHAYEGEFALGVDDPSWDIYLEVAGCDETGQEYGHEVSLEVLAVTDEFGTVPKLGRTWPS